MSSEARLGLIDTARPTVMCCTPTYALRLAEVAARTTQGAERLAENSVRVLIVAGEPGGSIPATRQRIESAWRARVIDHHGLTESGPVSFECWESPGRLHLNECEYICEVLELDSNRPTPDGHAGELVLTNLGRTASPVIRYRTGDLVVRRSEPCACGRTLAWLDGGVRARADDMVNVRGVNVYPAAVEDVLRRFHDVAEYRATVSWSGALRSLALEIELVSNGSAGDPALAARRVSAALKESLGLHVPIQVSSPGTLPRFEMKSRRFVVLEANDEA